jgi:uncharacterized membrane protein
MIFEQKEDFIPATMAGNVIIGSLATFLLNLPICLILYYKHGISPVFLVGYYLFGIMITITYCIITFISAIKEYAKITKSYFIGLPSSIIIFFTLHQPVGMPVIDSIIFSLALGFLIINILLIYYVLSFFKTV